MNLRKVVKDRDGWRCWGGAYPSWIVEPQLQRKILQFFHFPVLFYVLSISMVKREDSFEVRHPRCVSNKSKCNVYAICRQTQPSTRWYANLLNVNLIYMFRPQSLAIIRLYKRKLINQLYMHFVGVGCVYSVGWEGQVRDLASVGGLAMDWLGSMYGLRCYAYLYLCFLDWDT